MNLSVGLLALVLAVILYRRGGMYRVWGLYAGLAVSASLLSGSADAMPRHAVAAFPLGWAVANTSWVARSRVLALAGLALNALLLASTTRYFP